VLERDGHVCRIGGPRCRDHATSVHHIIPSSQAPELFWEPSNLAAACGRCNYGDRARIAAQNTRQRVAMLEEVIWRQDAEIARLTERLTGYESGERERLPATPRIY
jgi:hypothetical protein